MTNFQFDRGDAVYLVHERASASRSTAIYEVIARLPSEGSAPRYSLKAANEPFSRVALEHTMKPAVSPELVRGAIAVPEEWSKLFSIKPGAPDESSRPSLAAAAG